MDTVIENEIWKSIPGWEGFYKVSNLGRVLSEKRIVSLPNRWGGINLVEKPESILKPQNHTGGYKTYTFWRGGKCFNIYAHRAVLETFISLRPKGLQACHNNGDKGDNRLINLRWDSPKNNQADRAKHGTEQQGVTKGRYKKRNPEIVSQIRQYYKIHGGNITRTAKNFGIPRTSAADIVNYRTWK